MCNETNYKSLKNVLMKLEQTEPLKCQNRFLLFLNKNISKKLAQQHFHHHVFLFFAAFILALQDFSSTISWGILIHRLKWFMYWMFSTEALFLHTYTLCIFFYTAGKMHSCHAENDIIWQHVQITHAISWKWCSLSSLPFFLLPIFFRLFCIVGI